MPDIDPAVRAHLSAAGHKGAASRWSQATPDERTEAAGKALQGRRTAAKQIAELKARVEALEQLVGSAAA